MASMALMVGGWRQATLRVVLGCMGGGLWAYGLSSCKTPGALQAKDVLPYAVGAVEPRLGDGYDSMVQSLRNGVSCVSGTTVKVSSAQSSINLSQNIDSKDLMREFSGEVTGTPRLGFLQLGASGGYYHSLATKDSVLNLVYAVKVQTGGEQLSGVSLVSDAKALKANPMLQRCGDGYVMQINRGGLLSITLSLDFGSVENRTRWQTKMKMSGPLGDLSKDLGNKVSLGTMDGSLTINVNQVGGIPSQALTSAKTCSLSSADDFAICKQRIDDLMAYATGSFPQQVESNPGVLSFITAPLRNLGAQITATVPADILQMRQQLDQWNRDNLLLSDLVTKSRQVGLPMDPAMESDITSNTDLIKQTATACFSYQPSSAPPDSQDWSACRTQFKAASTGLKKINADVAALNQLDVPADSEIGNSIFNPYDSKMSIRFAVASGRNWRFDPTHSVGSDGTASGGGAAAAGTLSSVDKQGALLTRIGQSYSRSDTSGQLDIFAGEAVGFVMNDVPGHFTDNQGLQTVYWRCLSCANKMNKLPTYRLRVRANVETGTAFTSHENITGTYRIVAYGLWRGSPNWPLSDAGGSSRSCGTTCPDPTSNLQTLVMSSGPGTAATAIGRDKTLGIQANVPVAFMMNEQAHGYIDNQGEIELILQCKRCNIASHAIILDEE